MRSATNQDYTAQQLPHRYINNETSLLSKYDIPITHLDFSYIEKCGDRKELEKILHVLKSGEEGYYPELTREVEKKLEKIYPKSKFLRSTSKVLWKDEIGEEEWNDIAKNLNDWITDVSESNRELEIRKGSKTSNPTNIRKPCRTLSPTEEEETKPQKVQSTDYAAWDKYDPDAEVLNMELKEEKLIEDAKKQNINKTKKKQVKFADFPTELECKSAAKEEKEKGNEYYKAGDYKTALKRYTASLDCFATVEAFNNRAMTNLKLSRHQDALKDCDSALRLDPINLKANWRKAVALDDLEEFEEALRCIETCIDIEPNDEKIQIFANCLRKKCRKTDLAKKRIMVEDITEDEAASENDTGPEEDQMKIVPIPGTSRMTEPHFIQCRTNDLKRLTNILYLKSSDQESLARLIDHVELNSSIRSKDTSKQIGRISEHISQELLLSRFERNLQTMENIDKRRKSKKAAGIVKNGVDYHNRNRIMSSC